MGEVELVDGSEEGEARLAGAALDSGLGAVGNLLAGHNGEEITVAPLFALRAVHDVAPEPPGVGQVEAFEGQVEGAVIGVQHDGLPLACALAATR